MSYSSRCLTGVIATVIGFAGLSAPAALAEGSWLTVAPDGSVNVEEATAALAPTLAVQPLGEAGISLTVNVAGLEVEATEAAGGQFVVVGWPEASVSGRIGAPAIPVVRRLFVAPPEAEVTLEVGEGPATVIDLAGIGLPTEVMPVQPPIPKIPGARENAVFQFDEAAYGADVAGPAERAVVTELGIVRGQRLFMLEVRPVAYNPARGELTCWSQLSAQVGFVGGIGERSGLTALPGLDRVVLNPDLVPQAAGRGTGNYLIVVASTYESNIASFASAKQAQGFDVTTYVDTSVNATTIKNYIQSQYDGADPPDYVLLVGDTNTIPHWTGGGVGTPATDLPYSCMDGPTDWYPDIALGRFPVRSSGDVQAIVDKTLYYENGPLSDPDYVNRAVFMASEDNYTVSEGTHNWVINNYMIPNDIVSDKLYCHTYNATTQQVRDSFNDGRFFGIYSGHGGTYSWADGPAFSQSDVNNLTNADMYPFVCSFACITGTYTVTECFTETWILAAGKGALAIYGSSVNSYWTEDDVLEKRLFDAIYDEDDDVPAEVGPVWNDTRMRYLNQMGSGSTTRRYFEMYNLMGDPSLPFPGAGGLEVTPGGGLDASGDPGGPFDPDSVVYTLHNSADVGIDYSVTKSEAWLSVTNATGYLAPDGTAEVTVSINANANTLEIGDYSDTVYFVNTTDHKGDTTREVTLQVGGVLLVHDSPLDTDPGWSLEGDWEFGVPAGGGSYDGDPTSGQTGSNVYGYNLDGDYTDEMPLYYLTTTAFDCTNEAAVELRFWRWLGVESAYFDHADVQVSNNGTSWTTVWEHTGSTISDDSWSEMVLDISSVADGEATVYLRWGMGPTDGSATYPGWNIDDVQIWGVDVGPQPTCDDGIQNQGEDRIDCGGPCPPCECTSDGQCDDGTYCDGAETCDAYGYCQEGTPVDCPDDGFFCNGTEFCDEQAETCGHTGDPCVDDGEFCNGGEFCDEGADICSHTGDPCVDDGEFCNGDEFCDEGADTCGHTGDPCTPPEVCDEQADMCVLESTTIDSAASCQDHGGQEYCLDMAMGRSATVEPRQGGVTKLMLQTVDPVEAGSTTADATCVNNTYEGAITVTADGTTTVQVNPGPLPDQDCCTIVFAGGIEDSIDVQLLAGDVDGDVNVSTADGSSITQRLGLALDGSNFWYDVDLDQNITTADGSFVTQRLGNVAPSCP